MYKRDLQEQLILATKYYPVITLTGPRQSGKTTLVKLTFADYNYFNLEDPSVLEQIELDPKKFLKEQNNNCVIIDEIQNFPKLLSYIQVEVDNNPQKGRFILTGSHQFSMLAAINQSLAGRTDLLTLYPLSICELKNDFINFQINDWLFNGFYPRIYADQIPASRNSKNYISTYVERDVRKIVNIKDIKLFQKFIKLCAGRIGQLLNFESICNETGVSHNTIKSWLSILEASHIIYTLQPYYENFGKRLIKSAKIYFVDVGIACSLLGITSVEYLNNHPLKGMLFENLLVMDLIKTQANNCIDAEFYFYRDHNQNEVDVIVHVNNELIPIEIKLSETFNKHFLKGIKYFMNLTAKAKKGYLVYAGEVVNGTEKIDILNYLDLKNILCG